MKLSTGFLFKFIKVLISLLFLFAMEAA